MSAEIRSEACTQGRGINLIIIVIIAKCEDFFLSLFSGVDDEDEKKEERKTFHSNY